MNYTYFGNRIERSPLGNMGVTVIRSSREISFSGIWNWES